jgi:hypothetical protein
MNPSLLNFRTTGRFLFLAVFIFSIQSYANDTNQWNIKVAGIRIVAPAPDGKPGSSGAFFSPPGVTVTAIVQPLAGKIVSINQSDSKLDTFTDDKGTDLMATKSEDPFNKPGINMAKVNEGGISANVDFQAAGLPAKGATVLNISGKLSVKVATGTRQFAVESVDIKTNASFTCGDLPLKISAAGFSKGMFSSKEEFSATFSSTQDLDGISTLEFFDAQGGKIEARKSSWGGGLGNYFVEYVFKTSLDHAKIVVTCWQDLKTVEVPIFVKTGVGL